MEVDLEQNRHLEPVFAELDVTRILPEIGTWIRSASRSSCEPSVTVVSSPSARDLRAAFNLLARARVMWLIPHCDAAGLPLCAGLDSDTYKCLFLDVGFASQVTEGKRTNAEVDYMVEECDRLLVEAQEG